MNNVVPIRSLPTVGEAIALLDLPISAAKFREAFQIEGPALISFSGGRTSALMLWCILVAHGWRLPDDVKVCFQNTGKERQETLRFVHECETAWGVSIAWVEWRPREKDLTGKPTFREWMAERYPGGEFVNEEGFELVGFNSASRQGEPFEALIAMKQYAPNAVTRFCSVTLKVRAASFFAHSIGWTHWTNMVGLRHDEGHRVLKALARNDANREPFKAAMPLAKALITKRHVLAFWWGAERSFDTRTKPQGFDLELRDYEGNCDLCFLKSRAKKVTIIRENPGCEDWWIAAEELARQKATGRGGRFVTEYSYEELAREAHAQPLLFDLNDGDEYDAECGLWCSGDEE